MNTDSKAELLVKNVSWIYLGKIVTQIFGFIVSILVIRKLSVEVFGTINFLGASFIVFQVLAVSPIISVLHRYIPELVEDRDYIRLKRLIFSSFGISSIALFMLMLILYFFQVPFAEFFKITNFGDYIPAFIFFVATQFFRKITVANVTSLLLHKDLAIFRIIESMISPVVYLLFLPVLNVNIMLLIGSFLSLMIVIPSIWVLVRFIRRGIIEQKKVIKSNSVKKRILRFGLLSSFNELGAGLVGKTSDFFIIAALGSQYFVGLYSFAHRLFKIVHKLFPLNDFLSVVRPIFFRKFSGEIEDEEFIKMYNFIVKVMVPIFLFPLVYFIIFGKGIINYVYDPKYMDSYLVACVILGTGLVTAVFYPLGLVIRLFEKMEIALYSKIIVIFSIIAGIYGMKMFGIVGVALATMFGDLLKNIFMYFLTRKHAPVCYRFGEMINYFYISSIMLIIFSFLNFFVTNIFSLILFSMLFGIIFLLLSILYHSFNNSDLVLLNKIANSSKVLKRIVPIIIKIHGLKLNFVS